MIVIRVDQSAPPELVHKVKAGDQYHVPGIQPGDLIVSEEIYNELHVRLGRLSEVLQAA